MSLRGALIGAVAGGFAFYIIDPNKGEALDFIGWIAIAPQMIGVAAIVGAVMID